MSGSSPLLTGRRPKHRFSRRIKEGGTITIFSLKGREGDIEEGKEGEKEIMLREASTRTPPFMIKRKRKEGGTQEKRRRERVDRIIRKKKACIPLFLSWPKQREKGRKKRRGRKKKKKPDLFLAQRSLQGNDVSRSLHPSKHRKGGEKRGKKGRKGPRKKGKREQRARSLYRIEGRKDICLS